jgi:hypothetical protein
MERHCGGRQRERLLRWPKCVFQFQFGRPQLFQRQLERRPELLQRRFKERHKLFLRFQLQQDRSRLQSAAGDKPANPYEPGQRFDQGRADQPVCQHESQQTGRWQRSWYERQILLLGSPNASRSDGDAEQQRGPRGAELFLG